MDNWEIDRGGSNCAATAVEMADDNSKSTNGLYRVEREWTVGRLAGTSFIVSELYAARFQPLGPCRVCGQNSPPTRVYSCALGPTRCS